MSETPEPVDPWQAVRHLCGTIDYTGGLSPHKITSPETLLPWLEDLKTTLREVGTDSLRLKKELADAERVISAARTAFAAFSQPPGSPLPTPEPNTPLDAEVLRVIRRAGDAGITAEDVADHIRDRPVQYPETHPPTGLAVYRSLGRLCDRGTIRQDSVRGPFRLHPYDAAALAPLETTIAATVTAHPGRVTSDNVQTLIDPALLPYVPSRAALLAALDRLCDRGIIWQQGAHGPYFPERQDCPDCESTGGINCPAHAAPPQA